MAILQTITENGVIAGLPAGNQGISIFKGIPYAKPPVGDLRWKAPQPTGNWEGTYNAYSFSDIPMQCRVPESSMYKKEFYPVDLPRSEGQPLPEYLDSGKKYRREAAGGAVDLRRRLCAGLLRQDGN